MVPENRIEKVAPMNCELLHNWFTTEYIVHVTWAAQNANFANNICMHWMCECSHTKYFVNEAVQLDKIVAYAFGRSHCVRCKCKYSTYRLITFCFLHLFTSIQYTILDIYPSSDINKLCIYFDAPNLYAGFNLLSIRLHKFIDVSFGFVLSTE